MSESRVNSYYVDKRSKLLHDFNKFSAGAKKILTASFGESEAAVFLARAGSEYEGLIPQLPYIGGKKNSSTANLIGGAWLLAIIRSLEPRELSEREIGRIIFDLFKSHLESKPRFLRWLAGRLMFSKSSIAKQKKRCLDSQLRTYSGDWVFEFIEGDGKNFDYGMDVVECGVCKFYAGQGAEKYLPYVCLGDYPLFRDFGAGMKRTQTLGSGGGKCDFRFKKGGQTPEGWPPEHLAEFKNPTG